MLSDYRWFSFFPEMKKDIKASLINVNYITTGGINPNLNESRTFIDEDIYEMSYSTNYSGELGRFRFVINLDKLMKDIILLLKILCQILVDFK